MMSISTVRSVPFWPVMVDSMTAKWGAAPWASVHGGDASAPKRNAASSAVLAQDAARTQPPDVRDDREIDGPADDQIPVARLLEDGAVARPQSQVDAEV